MDNLATDIANYLIKQYINDAKTFCSLSKTSKFFNALCKRNKNQKLLEFAKPTETQGSIYYISKRVYRALPGNVPHGLFECILEDKVLERTWYDQGKMVGSYTKWDMDGNVILYTELPSSNIVPGIVSS